MATYHHRSVKGSQQESAKLTEAKVVQIRRAYANEDDPVTMKQLAEEHGVSITVIWSVVHERSWRHCLPRERSGS